MTTADSVDRTHLREKWTPFWRLRFSADILERVGNGYCSQLNWNAWDKEWDGEKIAASYLLDGRVDKPHIDVLLLSHAWKQKGFSLGLRTSFKNNSMLVKCNMESKHIILFK